MIKNLVVVASGGALAFGLAGAVSPAMALAGVAHPAGVTRANLPMPDGTPIIRDSAARMSGTGKLSAPPDTPTVRGSGARLGCGHPGRPGLWNPPDPPVIKHSTARLGHGRPDHLRLWNPSDPPVIRGSTAQNAPPTIRDAKARTSGAECTKLVNPPGTPIIRDSAARFGDPDDGGQVQVFAAVSDPDAGGQ
jgi:hypothetical protein